MADLDLETIERALRWCAEAGRQATAGEVRAALAPLGWDQLLSVRALLADAPPARPLGPQALADLARGVPADVAAEREREGRYPRPDASSSPGPAPGQGVEASPAPRTRASKIARRQVVIRKAAPPASPPPPAPPRLLLVEELLLPAGRGELSRLIRRHGGRRPMLVAAIAATHRRADGAPVDGADLDAALEHHGLDRAFLRRERDELFHAVRAAAGVLATAAAALGHDLPGILAAIARLGLDADVERLREARRRDLRARATLSERALLWVGSGDALADLGLLEEIEQDLRRRLPEHLRALATTGEPLELGLARTLALPGAAVKQLMTRLSIDLKARLAPAAPAAAPLLSVPADRKGPPRSAPARAGDPRTAGRPPPPKPAGERPPAARPRGDHPSGGRPPGSRPSGGRPSGGRPSGGRPSGGRPSGGRPLGSRPDSGGRPGGRSPGTRPGGGPTGSSRPSTPRPSGGRPPSPRPTGDRSSGARPRGSRPATIRPAGLRPSGPRPPGRPAAPRPPGRPPGARPAGPRRPGPRGRATRTR